MQIEVKVIQQSSTTISTSWLRKMGLNLCVQGLTGFPFADGAPAPRLSVVNHGCSFICVLKWAFLRAGGHHELRGAAGGPGAGDGEGAVQGSQSGHAVRLHRRDRGPTAWRNLPVLPFPCALWKTGSAAVQGENSERPIRFSHYSYHIYNIYIIYRYLPSYSIFINLSQFHSYSSLLSLC